MIRKLFGVIGAIATFIIFVTVVVLLLSSFIPQYHDISLFVNFIVLSIATTLGFWIYDKINQKPEINRETNEIKEIKEKNSLKKEIAISIIAVIAISLIFYFSLNFISSQSKQDEIANYNDGAISFDYPEQWDNSKNKDSNFFNHLFNELFGGNDVSLDITASSSNGSTIEEIANSIEEDFKNNQSFLDSELIFINSTDLNDTIAYDIAIKANISSDNSSDNSYFGSDSSISYLRTLIFVYENQLYNFTFSSNNLDDIEEDFELIKNGIKFNQ